MQAEIVHNKKGEPRLLLTFDTDEERALFDSEPDLAVCVTTRELLDEDDERPGIGGPLVSVSFTLEQTDSMTLARVRELAAAQGIPGPDTDEHPEDYDGPCFCRDCLQEMAS